MSKSRRKDTFDNFEDADSKKVKHKFGKDKMQDRRRDKKTSKQLLQAYERGELNELDS